MAGRIVCYWRNILCLFVGQVTIFVFFYYLFKNFLHCWKSDKLYMKTLIFINIEWTIDNVYICSHRNQYWYQKESLFAPLTWPNATIDHRENWFTVINKTFVEFENLIDYLKCPAFSCHWGKYSKKGYDFFYDYVGMSES